MILYYSLALWTSKNPRWPTKIGYRRHLISFTRCLQNHGMWYIIIRLFLCLRTDSGIFLDISTICGYPGPSQNPRWPLQIWKLKRVSQLLLIIDENLACDISSSGCFYICNQTMACCTNNQNYTIRIENFEWAISTVILNQTQTFFS